MQVMVVDKPKVSILLITYNQEMYIGEAIRSAVEQNYDNLQVVVADDCSTDRTSEIVMDFASRYPERVIPVIGDKNLGITGNCNRGLKYCDGKYTAHQGGDDILLPDKVQKQVEWFEVDANRVLCGHDVEVFFNNPYIRTFVRRHGRAGRNGVGNKLLYEYGVDSFFMGTSMMWRTAAVPDIGFDMRLPIVADWKFILDVVGSNGIWGSIPGIFARYRRHDTNISVASRFYRLHRDCIKTVLFSKIEHSFSDESYYKARAATYYNLSWQLWAKGNYSRARRCYWSMLFSGKKLHFYIYKKMFRFFMPDWLAGFELFLRRKLRKIIGPRRF